MELGEDEAVGSLVEALTDLEDLARLRPLACWVPWGSGGEHDQAGLVREVGRGGVA